MSPHPLGEKTGELIVRVIDTGRGKKMGPMLHQPHCIGYLKRVIRKGVVDLLDTID